MHTQFLLYSCEGVPPLIQHAASPVGCCSVVLWLGTLAHLSLSFLTACACVRFSLACIARSLSRSSVRSLTLGLSASCSVAPLSSQVLSGALSYRWVCWGALAFFAPDSLRILRSRLLSLVLFLSLTARSGFPPMYSGGYASVRCSFFTVVPPYSGHLNNSIEYSNLRCTLKYLVLVVAFHNSVCSNGLTETAALTSSIPRVTLISHRSVK